MSISELNVKERSLLFATLATMSYNKVTAVRKSVREFGFTKVKFYNLEGAQAYRFESNTDVVIACRGTQPTEFNDLAADLKAFPVKSETVSRVHRGFKAEVDVLWPAVSVDVECVNKRLWFCGHSLGAAMATIMAGRCAAEPEFTTPTQLYTFGSPRVGWPTYVKSLKVDHIRWQNNNDIVTRVPLRLMNYKHHGRLHYINSKGAINATGEYSIIKRFFDRLSGMLSGLLKGSIDNFSDHSMDNYVSALSEWVNTQDR